MSELSYKLGDYLNAINYSKEQLIREDTTEQAGKKYPAFVVNRSLSYFIDTIMYANEMNMRGSIDSEMQFDFLVNSVRKRKRFSRWHREDKVEYLVLVKEYFGYNDVRAKEALELLTDNDIKKIEKELNKGGKQ